MDSPVNQEEKKKKNRYFRNILEGFLLSQKIKH